MKRWPRVALVLLGVSSFAAATVPAQPPSGPVTAFAGTTWHSVRIDGDTLFFAIRDIGIRFEDSTRFVAAVRLLDGQQVSRTGSYRLTGEGTMILAIDGLLKATQVRFRRDGQDLVIQDAAYDATLRLAPGKMKEERWF
jgi:hypothetical protein